MSITRRTSSKTYDSAYLSKYRFLTAKIPGPDFLPDLLSSTEHGVEYVKSYARITDAINYEPSPLLGSSIVYDFCVLGQDFFMSNEPRSLLQVTLRINIILVRGVTSIDQFLFNFRVYVTYGLPRDVPITGVDDIYVNPVDLPFIMTEPMITDICDVPIGMTSRKDGDVCVAAVNVTIPELRYTNSRERFRLHIVPTEPYVVVQNQIGVTFVTSVQFAQSILR